MRFLCSCAFFCDICVWQIVAKTLSASRGQGVCRRRRLLCMIMKQKMMFWSGSGGVLRRDSLDECRISWRLPPLMCGWVWLWSSEALSISERHHANQIHVFSVELYVFFNKNICSTLMISFLVADVGWMWLVSNQPRPSGLIVSAAR